MSTIYLRPEDYERKESLKSLGRLYLERGGKLSKNPLKDGMEKTYDALKNDHYKLYKDRLRLDYISGIPGYRQETVDGVINIKGVSHGKAGLKCPKDGIEKLNEEISEVKGAVLLEKNFLGNIVEEGLGDKIYELDTLTWAKKRYKEQGKELKKPSKIVEKMLKLSKFIPKTSNDKIELIKTLNNSFESLKHWKDALMKIDAFYLPLHLEHEYNSERSPKTNLFIDGRSYRMGAVAEEYLKQYDESVVNLYVGMAHAPQIRDYFEIDHSKKLEEFFVD